MIFTPVPGSAPGTNTLWTTAKLRVGSRPYVTIDATDPARDGRWSGVASWYSQPGNRPGFAYQARADVTPEIRDAAAVARRRRAKAGHRAQKLLDLTVADVQAGRGYNRHGGWTLLVAWETPDQALWSPGVSQTPLFRIQIQRLSRPSR